MSAIIEQFDRAARVYPDRPAVESQDFTWSYARLAEESLRVAEELRADPRTRAGEPVALRGEHDAATLAAILGILRAQRIWVPIHPRSPLARQQEIVAHAGVRLLLGVKDGLRTYSAIDRAQSAAEYATQDPRTEVAYILYTSGSTGVPKGVFQSHDNLLHHARTYASSLALTPADRLSVIAPLSVDAALMDVFAGLVTGATLCLWDAARRGTEGMARWLGDARITIYHSTPTVFRFWTRELSSNRVESSGASHDSLATVRRVVLGEEATEEALLARDREVPIGERLGSLTKRLDDLRVRSDEVGRLGERLALRWLEVRARLGRFDLGDRAEEGEHERRLFERERGRPADRDTAARFSVDV